MSEERGVVKKGHFKGYIINCVARMPLPPPPLCIENREGLYYNNTYPRKTVKLFRGHYC